jgi:hypothetical protein
MSFTLRPAQAFVTLGNTEDRDDFDVMDGSRRIGRVYRASMGQEPWCWSLSTAISPNGFAGRAATRVLALQMLVDTYRAVKVLDGAEREYGSSGIKGRATGRRTIRSLAGTSDIAGSSRER